MILLPLWFDVWSLITNWLIIENKKLSLTIHKADHSCTVIAMTTNMGLITRTSPDIGLVTNAGPCPQRTEVVRDCTEVGIYSGQAVHVPKLPGHGNRYKQQFMLFMKTILLNVKSCQKKVPFPLCCLSLLVKHERWAWQSLIEPAKNISVLLGPMVVTDRLATDHDVAWMRSGSPDQLNHWEKVFKDTTTS